MTSRKVTCSPSISEIGGEQLALPQHEEESSLPLQDSSDDVAANSADLPLVAPPGALDLPKPSVDNSVTRTEFHVLVEMMKALQQQLFPQPQLQQQQPATCTQLDTLSSIPSIVPIPTPSPPTAPSISIGMPAPSTKHLQTWRPPPLCSVHSPLSLSEDEWNTTIKTNVTGSWLVSKYVCELMLNAKQKGSIINVSSIAGLNRGQLPGALAYAVSKTGLNCMAKVMAMELGVHNIRVNSISPGLFKSEMTEALMQKEWLNNVVLKTYPLKALGTSDPALTSLVRYLIHDSSEYVSGNVFPVELGATLPGVPIFSSL
ncbi:hypothetical protein ACLOJK_008253 [Asimina triloba]